MIGYTMPLTRYHAMLIHSIMVFFAPKLLIYMRKKAKKMTVKIMVFSGPFGVALC